MDWYIKVLKNYAGFEGRARRKEYWMFYLINVLIGLVFGVITVASGNTGSETAINIVLIIYLIYTLAVLIPGLAVTVRRLHDTGRSGWWIISGFIPVLNIVLLVFMFLDSDAGDNEYGANPKAAIV